MLDLIIVIILIRKIIAYAKSKGLNTLKWGILFSLNWFVFELLGISLATAMLNIELTMEFMMTNPSYAILLSIFGIGCGFLGYLMTKVMMDKAVV